MSTRTARPPTHLLHLATTAQHGMHLHLWQLITGALVIALLIYALACAVTPFARCRRCEGNGRYRKPGRAWHPCRHCRGAGHRLR